MGGNSGGGGNGEAPGLHPLESDPVQKMLSQLQGQLPGLLAPSVPVFSSESCDGTTGSPGTCSVPQFPPPARGAVCGHPRVLLVSLSPLFSGAEVGVSVVCGLVAKFPGTRGSITHTPCTWSWLSRRRVWGGRGDLQPLGMPIPGLGWMHQAENNRGKESCSPHGPAGSEGLASGRRLQDQSKQEREGCDSTQEGLG